MKRIGRLLQNLLFPPKCAACGSLLDWQSLDSHEALCRDCLRRWESEKADTCGICAARVTACNCMTARMERAKCAGFRKLVFYRHGKHGHVQNRLIFHIKRNNDRQTSRFLASELLPSLRALTEGKTDVVLTWAPRSRSSTLKHGTDQARALAKELSLLCGFPCEKLIGRTFGKKPEQKALSTKARMRNAKSLYRLAPNADVKGKNVVFVDDIVTTGATAAACVQLLRRAGAENVFCLTVASNDTNQTREKPTR
ncbi:MAG: ComF family protein [Clostridia bacterium]|nr:ComF family protein [Clostridia bacterium]